MAATTPSRLKRNALEKDSLMGKRMRFVCQRLACRRQVEIEIPPGSGAGHVPDPLCICGAKMKRAYAEPVFRELSKAEGILHFGDSWPQKTQGRTAG